MNAKGIERFNDAVQALLLSQPFFGTLLMKMKHEPTEGCGTLFTNGSIIGYDPEFLAMQSLEQAQFCVAHEVLHAAWMHLDRIRHYLDTGIGPDGKPLNTGKFNRALDYPINASLVASKVGEVPAGIQICLDRKYTPDWTPEEVYCDMPDEDGDGGAGSGDGPQALDDHRPADGNDVERITAADVQQAATTCKVMRGELPAGIDRLLGEIKKPEHSPWKRLRRMVTSSLAGYDATTWRRLQRRMIVRRIGMPGRTAQGAGTVGIVVDTSGSIGDEMLALFGGHMAAIVDDARPQLVKIYWVDAKVHRVDNARNGTQLRHILSGKVPGGGGTDMRKGVNAALEDKCDCIVVLTDGYTPFCDSPKPTFWAITDRSINSPHGETIHIT